MPINVTKLFALAAILHAQVAALGPEELLSEFRALQELALASYSSQGDDIADDTRAGDQKSKNKIDSEMEEFLLQQVLHATQSYCRCCVEITHMAAHQG
jgi:hypothetical protein